MDGDGKAARNSLDLVQQFLPWIDPTSNEPAPVVLVGAGLSYGLVPVADKLAGEVADRRRPIEAVLGVTSGIEPIDATTLYQWADDCIQKQIAAGRNEAESKKLLADAIGLTFDPRFLAQADIPLRGTTPRHRVLSRLAREGRVEALWSFNWDCWLEASLECVGLRKGERLGAKIAPSDWKLRYHVWVDDGTDPEKDDTVPVFKAHGCVQALHENRGDFVIAKSEMERSLKHQPVGRSARMTHEVSSRWAVTLGWSGTEGYVQELLAQQKAAGMLGKRLTIVDTNPSQTGHLQACSSYNCDVASAAVRVESSSPGTTDDLFFWIQTRRGLAAIQESCGGLAVIEGVLRKLHDSVPEFHSEGLSTFWCVSFLDSWLPIWLRTCFMVGAQAHSTKPGEEAEILPTEQRDAHVPWACNPYGRQDLQAAAAMIVALDGVEGCAQKWDYETFPGAIWSRSDQVLVLPVPIWVHIDGISTVSLKPMVESVHWSDKGRIRVFKVLPLDCPSLSKVDGADKLQRILRWKEALASLFGHSHLAMHDSIETIELAELGA